MLIFHNLFLEIKMKLAKTAFLVLACVFCTQLSAAQIIIKTEPNVENIELGKDWDKTFAKSDEVFHQKVLFKNRYGFSLAGDLYLPKSQLSKGAKIPAVAVCGPYGAVKEQAAGFYAQELAKRGFVTLAFDPSFTGESSGNPRNISSNDINSEDFSAAVDFLGIQDFVDRKKISIIGIGGFGGFGLNAAAIDIRISKIVASTLYDMSRLYSSGYDDGINFEGRTLMKEDLSEVRYDDALNSSPTRSIYTLPFKLSGNEPKFIAEYFDYYKTKRGYHPRSVNSNSAWSVFNQLAVANSPLSLFLGEIVQPVLVIQGQNSHALFFSEETYRKLRGENKELFIVKDASHTDLFDKKVPFDKIENFLRN